MDLPKIFYLGCLSVILLAFMVEATTPPGIAKNPARATCKIKKYKMCYNLEHVCPKFCPDSCTVECASCKPICGPGSSPPEDDSTSSDSGAPPKYNSPSSNSDDGDGNKGGKKKGDDDKGGKKEGDNDNEGKKEDNGDKGGRQEDDKEKGGDKGDDGEKSGKKEDDDKNKGDKKEDDKDGKKDDDGKKGGKKGDDDHSGSPSPSGPSTSTPYYSTTPSSPTPTPTPSPPSNPPPLLSPKPPTPSPSPKSPSPSPKPPTPSSPPKSPSPSPKPPTPSPPTPTPPSPSPPTPSPPTHSTPPPSPTPPSPSTPPSPTYPTPPTPSKSPQTPPSPTPSPPPSTPTPSPKPPTPSLSTPSTPSSPSGSSGVASRKKVRCRNKYYGQCYNQEHVCPASCPTSCQVDCVSCKPVCNCDYPGAVCQDPRFIGGDGITFYFHGKKGKDFCIVSDPNLHINAHFIGKRNENMTRDFTWVQSIGILFDNHHLFLGARKTSTWDDAKDRLALAFNGEPVYLEESIGSKWLSTSTPKVTITRTSETNNVVVEVQGKLKITTKVVPITEEESRVHNYDITNEDCFAHLELGFKFDSLTGRVDGVLGKTYRDDYVSRVKMGVPMPIMGGDREYATSSIFATDCLASRFDGVQEETSLEALDLASVNCASGMNGEGVVCKR